MADAAQLYRRGWEEARDTDAGTEWAGCLYHGSGVTRNGREAVRVAREVAEAGGHSALYYVAEVARTGKGAPMDAELARDCHRRLLAATEKPVAGRDESLRCLYRALTLRQRDEAPPRPEAVAQLMRQVGEMGVLPNARSLAAVALLPTLEDSPQRVAELREWLRRAAEAGEAMHPLAELLAEMALQAPPMPAAKGREFCLRLERAVADSEEKSATLTLLCRLWAAAAQSEGELGAAELNEASEHAAQTLTQLLQVMRFGESGLAPAQRRGLDVSLSWPYGPLMTYAWVYQPDPLQDLAAAEQGYRSDVAAYLRVTNETDEVLTHFHLRVCDIAGGEEYEAEADDVELQPGETAEFSLCMRGLTYSESMYAEVSSGPYRAEFDSENTDIQALLGYPAPSPAELCWETGFWGTPVLRVFNPGTEPLSVSLASEGGVPCWFPKTVPPQEEVRFGWYDMMNLRMPAPEECAVLHTEGYGDMSLRITPSERDDTVPGWRDWLRWFLGGE